MGVPWVSLKTLVIREKNPIYAFIWTSRNFISQVYINLHLHLGTCALAEYQNAEHLGKMLLADLTKAIDKDFPIEPEVCTHNTHSNKEYKYWYFCIQDKLRQVRAEHENYARQLCVSYVPRIFYLNALDSFLETQAWFFFLHPHIFSNTVHRKTKQIKKQKGNLW